MYTELLHCQDGIGWRRMFPETREKVPTGHTMKGCAGKEGTLYWPVGRLYQQLAYKLRQIQVQKEKEQYRYPGE